MEVRCASCKKLFRVSEDKITGSGVKFVCTRCGQYVTITREDFEQYLMSKTAAPATAPVHAASAVKAAPAERVHAAATAPKPADHRIPGFDLNSLKAATLGGPAEEKPVPPVFVKPAPAAGDKSVAKTEMAGVKTEAKPAAAMPKHEIKIPPHPKPQQAAPVVTASPEALPGSASVREAHHPAPLTSDAGLQTARSSGAGKKILVFLLVLLVLGGAGFGVKLYLEKKMPWQVSDGAKVATLPDGLQVKNAAGAVDPATGDLVITGVVENATDKPRPAWFILAEVYDAQGGVLVRGKLLNGKQVYTRRDYEIMAKRGINVEELKQKILQEQGLIIPQNGSTSFEMRIMEPPVGVASFNATLQPFDPVQIYKEIAEEQK